MFIKDFISYFDIIFPLFILYLFFLLLACIKNRNNKWIKTRNLVFFFFKLFIFINLYYNDTRSSYEKNIYCIITKL